MPTQACTVGVLVLLATAASASGNSAVADLPSSQGVAPRRALRTLATDVSVSKSFSFEVTKGHPKKEEDAPPPPPPEEPKTKYVMIEANPCDCDDCHCGKKYKDYKVAKVVTEEKPKKVVVEKPAPKEVPAAVPPPPPPAAPMQPMHPMQAKHPVPPLLAKLAGVKAAMMG